MREWVSDPMDTYYIIGSAVGPHPYPFLVREFQSVIGTESKKQMLEQAGCLPDAVFACVGGGSNAIGMFYPLIQEEDIELIGVEAGGLDLDWVRMPQALQQVHPVFWGAYTIILQNKDGQVRKHIQFLPVLIIQESDLNMLCCNLLIELNMSALKTMKLLRR